MAASDTWNAKLIELKNKHGITNKAIAEAINVKVDRVNSWTKQNGGTMEQCFYEFIILKIESGGLDLTI